MHINNRGFVYKEALILILVLYGFSAMFASYYYLSIKILEKSYLLQKQKIIELVLGSYLDNHHLKEETKQFEIEDLFIQYDIEINDKNTILTATITDSTSYKYVITYDNKEKRISQIEYNKS